MNIFKIYIPVVLLFYTSENFAYTEAEKRAFCIDYVTHIGGNYEKTKAYEKCYVNSNALIDNYEEKKLENEKKMKEQNMKREQQIQQEKIEQVKQKELQSRLDQEKKNQEDARLKQIQMTPFSVFVK